ncbi:hypothetical protein ACFSBZ_03050 [Amnibacterium flavum]|uniref:hypothetical protein n=1 Tax=Amnibacterium flavum TaxID=2173173 RepID=UPI0014029141|nr:hypothetical protein [Amnibacterium flavum]
MNIPTTTHDGGAERLSRSRTRTRVGLGVMMLAGLSVLTGCSVVGSEAPAVTPIAAESATIQDVCDTATELTEAGEPGRALDLIEQYRDGRPVTPTPSPTVTRRTATVSPSPTPSPTATPIVDCEPERLAAIDALGGTYLAEDVPSPASSFAKDWNAVVAAFIVPIVPALLSLLGIVIALLVLARLAALLPRMPWLSTRTKVTRGVLGLGGLGLIAVAAVVLATTFPLGELGLMIGFAVVGLIGSVLAGTWLAGRLALSIEVRQGDKSVREASARVIALLQEIGAAPPRGIEVPVGTDVTALQNALVTAPVTNPFVQIVRAVVAAIIGSTPWRVLVSIEDEAASVIVTRNGRTIAAHEIHALSLLPAGVKDPGAAKSAPPAVAGEGPEKVERPAEMVPFLSEAVAAVVLVTLSVEYDGFEGLAGATQWKSVARGYIATTAFRDDPATARRLLGSALEVDPANLVADISLQYLLNRHAADPDDLVAYLAWLEHRIGGLLLPAVGPRPGEPAPVEVMSTADEGASHERVERGHLDIVRRLLLSYGAAGLNLREVAPSRVPDAVLRRNVRRLVDLLADDQPPSGALRDRMRPIAGLMFVELVPSEKGSGSPVDRWADLALESASPSIAFNAACYFSTGWRDELSAGAKKVIEARIADRLQYALTVPHLRMAAWTDPVLARHRDHPWYRELLHRFE